MKTGQRLQASRRQNSLRTVLARVCALDQVRFEPCVKEWMNENREIEIDCFALAVSFTLASFFLSFMAIDSPVAARYAGAAATARKLAVADQ